MTADHIKEIAHELVQRLKEDISKAVTREEHIRTSARANEADLLLEKLSDFFSPATTEQEQTDDPENDRGASAA